MWTRSVDRSALDHSRFREHSSIVREPSLVPTTAQCPLHFLHDRRKKRGSTGRGIKYDSPLVNKVPADPISRENFTPFMIQPEQGRKKLFLLGKPFEGLDRLSAVLLRGVPEVDKVSLWERDSFLRFIGATVDLFDDRINPAEIAKGSWQIGAKYQSVRIIREGLGRKCYEHRNF